MEYKDLALLEIFDYSSPAIVCFVFWMHFPFRFWRKTNLLNRSEQAVAKHIWWHSKLCCIKWSNRWMSIRMFLFITEFNQPTSYNGIFNIEPHHMHVCYVATNWKSWKKPGIQWMEIVRVDSCEIQRAEIIKLYTHTHTLSMNSWCEFLWKMVEEKWDKRKAIVICTL